MTTAAPALICSSRAGAAHCSGMNTFPVNRQPQGIPSGGQYAPAAHSEAEVSLLDPADRPLALAPGESEDYTEYADGEVITRLSVLRSDDGDTYHVEASKFLNFKDIVPASDLRTDDEGRDAWLDANSTVIEHFLRGRYDAEADTSDWEDVRTECSVSIQSPAVTGRQVISEAWNRTRIVALHNESDHGTFGSENMGRLLREHVEAQVVPADVTGARAGAARMTEDDIDSMVRHRVGHREISDACAVAIARTFEHQGSPQLQCLGRLGFGNKAAIRLELLDVYSDAPNPLQRTRIDMMLSWLVNGADND